MPRKFFRPQVNALDPRIVPASISTIDLGPLQGQVLNVQGSDDRDLILLTDRFVRVGSQSQEIAPGIVGIYADGNGGDDVILNIQSRVPVILHGGSGDDLITTRAADNFQTNIVYGDQGRNTLLGDPTSSALFPEALEYLTVDILGSLAVFSDQSPAGTSLEVTTDSDGITHVSEPGGETLLPPEIRTGLFDLGPGDDIFIDSSPFFRTIVDGGPGEDSILADILLP